MSIADGSELKKDSAKVSSRACRFAQHLQEHGLEEYEEREGVIRFISSSSPKGGKVRGTCMDLEKSYLRLTSAPKPSTVRPLKVLKEALKLVKGQFNKLHSTLLHTCFRCYNLFRPMLSKLYLLSFTYREIH